MKYLATATACLKTKAFHKAVQTFAFTTLFAGASPAFASFDDQYICETGDSATEMIIVVSGLDPANAVLQYRDQMADAASRVEMVSPLPITRGEFRYEGGGFTLVGRDDHALLFDAEATLPCIRIAEPDANEQAKSLLPYIVLSGDGLAIYRPGVPSGPMKLDFGSDSTLSILSRFLGSPGPEQRNEECGAGPMAFRSFGPLTINLQDGRLAGWSLTQDDRDTSHAVPVSLENNIMVGSALASLSSAFEPVPESSLGEEYFGEGVSAIAEDGLITTLWAGANCVFR